MSYLNKWHRDYAAESIKRFGDDEKWIAFAVECGQVATLASTLDDAFAADVAKTIVEIIDASDRLGRKSRRTITDKQRSIVAAALLQKFKTAEALAAAVWGLTPEEIANA